MPGSSWPSAYLFLLHLIATVTFIIARPCLPGEHIEGDWEVISTNDTDRDSAPWPCCEWDRDDYTHEPRCGNQDLHPYRWMGGHGCFGACAREPGLIHAKWVPSRCELLEFNPTAFCKLMKQRVLLFVGDSTMQQYHATLYNALVHEPCRRCLPFGHSDSGLGVNFGHLHRGPHWMRHVRSFRPDVLFMGIGPHIYGTSNWTKVVQLIVAEYQTLPKPPKLVWLTTTPGGCGRDILPDLPSRLNITFGKYNWDDFEEFDRIAKRLIRDRFTVLDLQPLFRRVDAHPGSDRIKAADDCMHFCGSARGPLALFPQLVHHALLHVLR